MEDTKVADKIIEIYNSFLGKTFSEENLKVFLKRVMEVSEPYGLGAKVYLYSKEGHTDILTELFGEIDFEIPTHIFSYGSLDLDRSHSNCKLIKL